MATVPARAFAELADTVTPQGILAICRSVDVPLAEALTTGAAAGACSATRSATPATSAP